MEGFFPVAVAYIFAVLDLPEGRDKTSDFFWVGRCFIVFFFSAVLFDGIFFKIYMVYMPFLWESS